MAGRQFRASSRRTFPLREVATVSLVVLAAVSGGTALVGFVVFRAARHEPAFYQQALRVQTESQVRAGAALERRLLDLHNASRAPGRWEAVFTQEQLNGWLATDLPEKFPSLLPPGTQDPRVNLAAQRVQVACRYERGKFHSVVSFVLDAALTGETNQLAIRVSKVRAGALPVPLKQFLDRISAAAGNAEIDLHWKQTEGDPVALVTVPARHEDYAHREIYLETIELRDGEIFLAGRTENRSEPLLAQRAAGAYGDAQRKVQR